MPFDKNIVSEGQAAKQHVNVCRKDVITVYYQESAMLYAIVVSHAQF